MVSVVVFEFSGVRCHPLRRALGLTTKNVQGWRNGWLRHWS
ncbi:acetyltransferase, partial [Vibrio cholerae]|nr:acetyltransferase [Vibrio cholerae]